jgi:hypothetical protein
MNEVNLEKSCVYKRDWMIAVNSIPTLGSCFHLLLSAGIL